MRLRASALEASALGGDDQGVVHARHAGHLLDAGDDVPAGVLVRHRAPQRDHTVIVVDDDVARRGLAERAIQA